MLGRGLQPRRGDRCVHAVGRLPGQRAGRGRRLGRAHAARPPRASRLDAGGGRPARRDPAQARGPLQGHAGHRVHGRGGAPVHAPDAQRQAARAGRGALRGRRVRGTAADQGRGGRDDRRRHARRAPAPLVRRHGALHCARPWRRRLAGRRQGHDRVHRARGRRSGGRREIGHPGAAVHRGRRRRRLPCRRRHPHRGGRQGLARGAGGPRHGPSCGDRRGGTRHRPQAGRGTDRRPRAARGRLHRDRRNERPDHHRRRAAGRGAHRRPVRDRSALVRRTAADRRAGERRHAGGRHPRASLRRRGDRAVPDRAHVHGRRSPAEDAGDDHGRRTTPAGRRRSTSCSRSSRATSRACSRRWSGGR